MYFPILADSVTPSEGSWGPYKPEFDGTPMEYSEFTEAMRKKLGLRDVAQGELLSYYKRYIEEGFSLDDLCEIFARDKTFAPISNVFVYPQLRVADLGSSIQDQEFQLAFKQQRNIFKGYNMQKRNALKRAQFKQPNRALARDKGQAQKFRERRPWNDRSQFFGKQLNSSVEIKSSWESKGAFSFAKLQKEEYKESIKSEILLEAGYVHYYNNELDQVNTRKPKKLATPKEPKYTYYSVKTMDDKHLLKFAEESTAPCTVVISDRILSLLMASTRSVLSWDIVVIKKNGKIYFDKRNNKQRVDIISVDETSRTPPEVSEDENNINSEYNLSMEATRINLQFQRMAVKQPTNPEKGPGVVALDENEPHPFKKDDQIPAPVGYIYKKFYLRDMEVICRCEVDGAIGTPDNHRFISIRALNEWKPRSREDWRSLLDGSQGRVLTTEIKNNACKFARWVSQATIAGTEEIKLGFVSRVDAEKKAPHVVLGVGTYMVSQLAQQIGLTKRNMWGILNSIASEMSRLEDGTYTLVKLPGKHTIQLFRISTSVTGTLIFRKVDDKYQFLLLKSGDNIVLPFAKTEPGEESSKTVRRLLNRDLGISTEDFSFCSDYKYVSQFEDSETYEERSEVMFAGLLKEGNFELTLSENYGDFEWHNFEDFSSFDSSIQLILNDFKKFAEEKGGLEKVF